MKFKSDNGANFFVFIVFATILFAFGAHNVDNAWNISYLNQELGTNFTDSNAFQRIITPGELYVMGAVMEIFAFMFMALSAFYMGRMMGTRRAG